MTKEEYNNVPVFYCKNCLSLRIRDVESIEDSEYCDGCGSTDIEQTSIEQWDAMYIERYGHSFLDKY